MGNFSSRPQEAPPVPEMPQAPPVPEDTPQVVASNIMQADTQQVEEAIQRALADESTAILSFRAYTPNSPPPSLTVTDAQCIIECLREKPRLDTLNIVTNFHIQNDAVLNVFRNGLPLCTSVSTVILLGTKLSNEGLECLLPAFYNTSITSLNIGRTDVQGQHGGELSRDLRRGNNTLVKLILNGNPIGPEFAIGLGKGVFAGNNCLQILYLIDCNIGNESLANLLLPTDDGMINNSLTDLYLCSNHIEGAEGGRQVGLLLQHCPKMKVLSLDNNHLLGPLGARALAPGLAAATQLGRLELFDCRLGNDGLASLVPPHGQVNMSLTTLNICGNNDIQDAEGGESVIALVSCCTNLDHLEFSGVLLSPDYRHRLNLLLGRKRLCTEAMALAGSAFSALFQFVEKAHRHEYGLSAIFLILHNDGDDYFCTANNRAIA